MVTTVDIEVACHDLNGLLKVVSSGGEVLISDGDTPVARLTGVAAPHGGERVAGLHPNAMSASDDFDAPLPDEFWTGTA